MARLRTTEQTESAHLAGLAAPVEKRLQQHRRFVALTEALSSELRSLVAAALAAEAASPEARDWLEEFVRLPPSAVLSQATHQELLRPSAAEISREAVELAQCVLANWFALKCFRAEKGLPAFAPPAEGEAFSWPAGLFEGVEAFAAPRAAVAELFQGFLAKHAAMLTR